MNVLPQVEKTRTQTRGRESDLVRVEVQGVGRVSQIPLMGALELCILCWRGGLVLSKV